MLHVAVACFCHCYEVLQYLNILQFTYFFCCWWIFPSFGYLKITLLLKSSAFPLVRQWACSYRIYVQRETDVLVGRVRALVLCPTRGFPKWRHPFTLLSAVMKIPAALCPQFSTPPFISTFAIPGGVRQNRIVTRICMSVGADDWQPFHMLTGHSLKLLFKTSVHLFGLSILFD